MAKKSHNAAGGKTLDEKLMGPEPGVIENVTENDPRVSDAYTWYNYFHNTSSGVKWVVQYMKANGYSKEQISKFESAPDWKVGMTACSIARMTNNGTVLTERTIKFLRDHIQESIDYAVKNTTAEKPAVNTSNIQRRLREKQSAIIADIEQELDNFYNNGYDGTFSFYSFCQKHELKAVHAKAVGDYYSRLLAEVTELVGPKPDKDLLEGYKNLTKTQMKKYYAFVSSICSDAERFANNKKAIKLPRKKKPKSTVDLVKNIKYKKEDSSLKLSSINPQTIIGAKALWIYNTKYKTIGVYNASSDRGLSIKGTTIIQFDSTTSTSKTVRKPEEVIDKVLKANPTATKKMFDALKTKDKIMNGRINTETILLKVIK